MWRIWAKAIGQKDGNSNNESDAIAIIRTVLILFAVVTNSVIVAGIIHHW